MEQMPIVLVVEDDELLQGVVKDALSEGGFDFMTCASGEDAVTVLHSGVTTYKALVTDINLKGRMSGWEVARHARQTDPDLAVIYMTGAAADDWPAEGVPGSILLQKPFAPAQLVTAVSQLLNKGSPSSS
ncbi:response regulator [Bradyrhizobium sp. WYCCWR 13023]|uniref:Response regulator n=1 Tax=Bradyrhizobium zhengyangense TaxID=2911009 RepID=A0A9X1REH1_9BRAD|nr:response regulator [Bradyrhizobium zhengyangense]MCG2631056.1 response regulator [Bradyrhizobium zhengyangense]